MIPSLLRVGISDHLNRECTLEEVTREVREHATLGGNWPDPKGRVIWAVGWRIRAGLLLYGVSRRIKASTVTVSPIHVASM